MEMNREVVVTCAVTGAGDTVGKHPDVPVTPEQIANAAIEAADAGAAIVHIHVRDPETGIGSRDVDLFKDAVERVRNSGRDVLINLTAGMGGDLVVDDDEFTRIATAAVLEKCGYSASLAANGAEALKLLKEESSSFQIVLLDLVLPDMDGIKILGKISEDADLRGLAVVMMSSVEEMHVVSDCLTLGARDYLIKPLCINAIKMLVRHLHRESQASAALPAPMNSMQTFEVVRELGGGSHGRVQLVRRLVDGYSFAMKRIPLQNLSVDERKVAVQEAMLLRVLVHPKIIRHFDDFIDGEVREILVGVRFSAARPALTTPHHRTHTHNGRTCSWLLPSWRPRARLQRSQRLVPAPCHPPPDTRPDRF